MDNQPRFRNLGEILLIADQGLGLLDQNERDQEIRLALENLAITDALETSDWEIILSYLKMKFTQSFPKLPFWVSSDNFFILLEVYREMVLRVALHHSTQQAADFFLAVELMDTAGVLLGRYLINNDKRVPQLFEEDPFWFLPQGHQASPIERVLTDLNQQLNLRDRRELSKWLEKNINSPDWTAKDLNQFLKKWESGNAIASSDLIERLFPDTLESEETGVDWQELRMMIRIAQLFKFLQSLFDSHFSPQETEFLIRSFKETCTIEIQNSLASQSLPLPCPDETTDIFMNNYFAALEMRLIEYDQRNMPEVPEDPDPRTIIRELEQLTLLDSLPKETTLPRIEELLNQLEGMSPWNTTYDFLIHQYKARINLFHKDWDLALSEYIEAVKAVRLRGGPKTKEILEETIMLAMMETNELLIQVLSNWIDLYGLAQLKMNLSNFEEKTRSFGLGTIMEKNETQTDKKTPSVQKTPLEEQIGPKELYEKVFTPKDLTEENVDRWLLEDPNGKRNLLMLASYLGSESTVSQCLQMGADPNASGDNHTTALTLAVDEYIYHRQIKSSSAKTQKYEKIIQILLGYDLAPSINILSEARETVLHKLLKIFSPEDPDKNRLLDLIRNILRYRPDLSLKDQRGRTPEDLGREQEAYEVLAWMHEQENI